MPYPNEHACRLKEPIEGANFRRANGERDHNGKKYDVIYQEREDGKWEDQAYRYPKSEWSSEEASAHCSSHGGKFEAASGGADNGANSFLTRFATRIYNTPLMILPDKLNTILSVLSTKIGLETSVLALDNNAVSARKEDRAVANKTGVIIGVVPVLGTLVHRTYGMNALSGLRSYESIKKDFFNLLSQKDVDAILFDIDSPGGEAAGLMDLVDDMYHVRGEKPVYAFSNTSAFSAAYALASAADKIFLSRDSGIGSVGCIAIHVDQSEMEKKMGLKYTAIYAGAKKNEASPHEPLSKEGMKTIQDIVDYHYDMFVKSVARNRGIAEKEVKGTEAGLYFGQKAVDVGFADGVMSYDNVFNKITADVLEKRGEKSSLVSNKKQEKLGKEVTKKMASLQEIKETDPDLYASLIREAQDKLVTETAKENSFLKACVSDLKSTMERQAETILSLEKSDTIRRENEIKAEANSIWSEKLASSDISPRLHSKVRTMVRHDRFVKDHTFDMGAFSAAVDEEIADWEKKGVSESVLGLGSSERAEVDSVLSKKVKEKEENKSVAVNLLALAGQKA